MSIDESCSRNCLSPKEKSIGKIAFLENLWASNFCNGRTQGIEISCLGPFVHSEVNRGQNFGSGYESKRSTFYHVLFVSVAPSVSVKNVIDSFTF